jgi:hypothetical protein
MEVDRHNVAGLKHEDLLVGQNVLSTITRYLQGARLGEGEDIVREYAYSALVTAEAARKVFDKFKPMRVFMSHGTYVDWGPALHTALDRGIP